MVTQQYAGKNANDNEWKMVLTDWLIKNINLHAQ